MKILKFGGSSLATAKRIRSAAKIVLQNVKRERVIVVVSAIGDATNQLLAGARLAGSHDIKYKNVYSKIVKHHKKILTKLIGKHNKKLSSTIDDLLKQLSDIYDGIYLLYHCDLESIDLIASFGERLSASLFAIYIQKYHRACFLDAREFIITDNQFTSANVQFKSTNLAIRTHLKPFIKGAKRTTIPIVTGYIGATTDKHSTTLGRNGSDYTAAIIAAALDARLIEIWTDVDGIYTADPHLVKDAFCLPSLSYKEAMELSYYGAKIIFPATFLPLRKKNIPILIKNTLNPSAPGTWVSKMIKEHNNNLIKSVTATNEITWITFRSKVNNPEIIARLFNALSKIDTLLITKSSSDNTIQFAISKNNLNIANNAIYQEFQYEIEHHLVSLKEKISSCIISLIGKNISNHPLIVEKLLKILDHHQINYDAIMQGSSGNSVSIISDISKGKFILRLLHNAFFEKKSHLMLAIIGVGKIGSSVIKLLQKKGPFLNKYDIRICGIANSKRFIISRDGIDLLHYKDLLKTSRDKLDPQEFTKQLSKLNYPHMAVIDCTPSKEIASVYPLFIKSNMHIITPNKKAHVMPWKKYQSLLELFKENRKYFFYSTTVGAGMPILHTLENLIASGDKIIKIEGIFSGTLNYILSHYDGSIPFSEVLYKAYQLGFTEPDPRNDLSGYDVSTKLLILARQLGWKMQLSQVRVKNLVPTSLRNGPFSSNFFKNCARLDKEMFIRYQKASKKGAVLRYVGLIQNKSATAVLKEVPKLHPLGQTTENNNIILFSTQNYKKLPLLIKGPGAGIEITARGVLADITKLIYTIHNGG